VKTKEQRHQLYLQRLAEDPDYNKKKYKQRTKKANSDRRYFASRRFTEQKSKAETKRKIPFRLDREKTINLIAESQTCSLSGRELMFQVGHPDCPSIDRINSQRGYTKSNIQIVSARINQAKNDMAQEEFVQMCLDVVKHNGYRVRAK
jgi:hypothetical protein